MKTVLKICLLMIGVGFSAQLYSAALAVKEADSQNNKELENELNMWKQRALECENKLSKYEKLSLPEYGEFSEGKAPVEAPPPACGQTPVAPAPSGVKKRGRTLKRWGEGLKKRQGNP